MITIIDYNMGNLRSIYNAFVALGRQVTITQRPQDLPEASLIVLPGVGAFADGINKLKSLNMLNALNEAVIEKGKPYLGICLGMQFLATQSYEHGLHKGFDWIPGTIEKINPTEKKYKVPHMGWNNVRVLGNNIMFNGLGSEPVFYFVHGYYFVAAPKSEEFVTSTCWHGMELTASVQRENIYGVQFHPEKSQGAGLQLLANILSLINRDGGNA